MCIQSLMFNSNKCQNLYKYDHFKDILRGPISIFCLEMLLFSQRYKFKKITLRHSLFTKD